MDWDDERFSRDDFKEHLNDLGILANHDFETLLTRTTKNTRTGNEFGFKPTHLTIGSLVYSRLCRGFDSRVKREGLTLYAESIEKPKPLPSSFWIRFREDWFQIRAFFPGHDRCALRPYEGRLPFRDVVHGGIQIRSLYRREEDRVTVQMSIKSRRPLRYTYHMQQALKFGKELIYDRHSTEADFFREPELECDAGIIYAVGDERLLINPGLWLVHRLSLDMTARQYKLLWMCMSRLKMINLYPDIAPLADREPPVYPIPPWSSVKTCIDNYTFEVEELSASIQRRHEDQRLAVLEGLFMWARRGSISKDLREVARRVSSRRSPAEHLMATRRCLITPTRCILNPPTEETSNSLLRHFQSHLGRFLRVQFVDDDGDFPVNGETLVIDDNLQGAEGVFARVRRALEYGISIAGRHYTFLCFSESQAREHGCWMISEEGEFTVKDVLHWIGDLTEERVVAKHAARHSLALSTTRAMRIDVKITRSYPDICRNGYTFTDGTGHCTQKVADEAARILGYTTTPVSAFQYRDGGVKGVLCVVEDSLLEDFEIRERASSVKFHSNVHELCVLKVATHSRATLNRQSIMLMEALGVPTETLLVLFLEEKLAIQGLEDSFDPRRLAVVSVFPLTQAFRKHMQNDPFVDNITSLVKCRLLSDLKWKAWIEVEKSAFLMGVADETDSLNEGEIFCQIHPPSEKPQVITGRCTIYRNPCLHPGDVRPVQAVDYPSLRHLRNVVVFSTRGQRDLPNMLAGGDLDGDMYSVIWDKRLLINDQMVHEPMDYTAPLPLRSIDPITIEQTKQHFVDFMRNDVLGRICNTHMALADCNDPRDENCLELAKLASQAVDFSKTGVPVSQRSIPKVEQYPDFMGKDFKTIRVFKKQKIASYESQKALGLMFREIDPEPEFHSLTDDLACSPGDPRLLSREEPSEYIGYMEAVAVHKVRYEFELEGLLRRYDISEAECVAGLLMRSRKTRSRVERDHELRVAVREAYASLKAAAVDRISVYLTEHPSGRGEIVDRHAWALASYKLTYDTARFASYLAIDWTAIDAELFADTEENDEIREDLEDRLRIILDGENGPIARRFSFAWLLDKSVFELFD